MQKKLQASGNGWQLYLSRPILKLLGYNPKEVLLLITSDNNVLHIEPIADKNEHPNQLIKNLHKSGGSYGLYLALPLLELMDVNPEEDFVDVNITGNKITLKKAISQQS